MNLFPTLRSNLQNWRADSIVINKPNFTIGRSLSCDLVVESISISRIQCVINERNNCWQLSDLSTNGTLVNNTLYQKATNRGYVKLKDGDTISFPTSGQKIEYVFNAAKELSYEQTDNLPKIHKQTTDIEAAEMGQTSNFHVCAEPQDNNIISVPPQQLQENNNETVIATHPSINSDIAQYPELGNNLLKIYVPNDEPGPSVKIPTNSLVENKIETNISEGSQKSEEINQESTENLPEMPQSDVEIVVQTSNSTENMEKSVEAPTNAKPQENKNEDIDVMESELTCSICSELFIKAMTLSCSHTFCQFCIHQWKKSKNTCPICRKNIDTISPTIVLDNFISRRLELCSENVQQVREEIKREREESASIAGTSKDPQPSSSRNDDVIDIEELEELVEEEDNYSYDSNVYCISDDEGEDDWDDSDEDCDASPKPYYGGYGRCYICQEAGHWASTCPLKPKRPRRY